MRIQASTGDARAEFNIGAHYYYGRGVPRSYSKANQWFRAAATQGYRYAEWSLGRDEYYGRGGPQELAARTALVASGARQWPAHL
ncbi:hypothetical protein [Metallibacterium sp.]